MAHKKLLTELYGGTSPNCRKCQIKKQNASAVGISLCLPPHRWLLTLPTASCGHGRSKRANIRLGCSCLWRRTSKHCHCYRKTIPPFIKCMLTLQCDSSFFIIKAGVLCSPGTSFVFLTCQHTVWGEHISPNVCWINCSSSHTSGLSTAKEALACCSNYPTKSNSSRASTDWTIKTLGDPGDRRRVTTCTPQ